MLFAEGHCARQEDLAKDAIPLGNVYLGRDGLDEGPQHARKGLGVGFAKTKARCIAIVAGQDLDEIQTNFEFLGGVDGKLDEEQTAHKKLVSGRL